MSDREEKRRLARIQALQQDDERVVREIIQLIREEARQKSDTSEGLLWIQWAFRGEVFRWLENRWLRDRPDLVDEVWNDTLARIWANIDKYDPEKSKFRTWVWNQAKYTALDYRREVNKQQEKEGPRQPIERVAAGDALEPDPFHVPTSDEQAMRRAFKRLNETEQRLVHLRHVVGLSHVEIAREGLVDTPEEHVRVYVNRATKRLGRFYEEEVKK